MPTTFATLRWSALAASITLAGCVTPGGGLLSSGTSPTATNRCTCRPTPPTCCPAS